jgi:hypothetical protein
MGKPLNGINRGQRTTPLDEPSFFEHPLISLKRCRSFLNSSTNARNSFQIQSRHTWPPDSPPSGKNKTITTHTKRPTD